MNIYISNLSSNFTEEELNKLFSTYGEVKSAEIMNDVFTGQSRGFGFVEMDVEEEAKKAIEGLNNSELNGLTVLVKPADPKKELKGSYKVGSGVIKAYTFRKN